MLLKVYKKIVGMQILVERIGYEEAFATIYQHSYDPVLVKLMQLEAVKLYIIRIWKNSDDKTIPKLDENIH